MSEGDENMHELDELLKHSGADEVLLHAGIKGMKWGFNDGEKNGKRTASEEEEGKLADQYDLSPEEAKELAKLIKEKKLSPKQIKEAVDFQKAVKRELKKNKGLSLKEQAQRYNDEINKNAEKWKKENPWYKEKTNKKNTSKSNSKTAISTHITKIKSYSPEFIESTAKTIAEDYKRANYSKGQLLVDNIKQRLKKKK